jgi:hypothetical protein
MRAKRIILANPALFAMTEMSLGDGRLMQSREPDSGDDERGSSDVEMAVFGLSLLAWPLPNFLEA